MMVGDSFHHSFINLHWMGHRKEFFLPFCTHSLFDGSRGGIPFHPASLPVLGLSEGDKQCIRDCSSIMARHLFADKSGEFIHAQVNALLSPLDIDSNVHGNGPMPERFRELDDYWNKSQGNVIQDSHAAILDGKELEHKEHAKYTLDLTTINPRILLLGPAGSEIYQETLVKELAKHFGAKLLIFDSHLLLGGLPSKESELLKDAFNTEKSCSSAKQSSVITDIARTMDPSANEIETSTSSEAPTSNGLESQHNLDCHKIPSTTVTAKKMLVQI
ncbi:hypothetical protein RYX36_002503, partial [Vicia faba]